MRNVRYAALAIVAIAAVAGLTGCSDKTHGDQSTLKLTEPGGKTGSFGVIGKPTGRNLTPGNGFAFSSPLQDSSKKTVGELDAICIATQPSTGNSIKGTCTGTATVPGGTLGLNVGGTNVGGNVSGSITGGTGKYAGATGTFSSQQTGNPNGNGPSNDTYNITLP